MDFSQGLLLPGGKVLPWESIAPGRYFLTSIVPTERWDVVLARVSSDAQRDGCSMAQQVSDGIRLSERRQNLVTAAYLDPGLSASKLSFAQRPGVRQLLDDVKSGKVRTVYVYKRDRVSRQEIEWIQFLKTCAANQVEILFTAPDEPPVGRGAYAQFQEHIIIAAAALESNLVRMRVIDNIRSRARNGQWVGGALPYGLIKNPEGEIVEDDLTAPIVKEIYHLADREMLGAARIADRINQMFPRSRFGRSWTKNAVEKVLSNRVYCGILSYCLTDEEGVRQKSEVASPHFPALIPVDLWQRVATSRAGRARKKESAPSRTLGSRNMLMGILRCGVCSRAMTSHHQVKRYTRLDGETSEYHSWYYECRNANERKGCNNKGSVRQHLVDDAVQEAVNKVISGLDLEQLSAKISEFREARLESIDQKLKSAATSLGQTESAISRNQFRLEQCQPDLIPHYENRLTELMGQKAGQLATISNLERQREITASAALSTEQTFALLRLWPTRFSAAPESQKRSLLAELIERAVWNPSLRTVDLVLRIEPSPLISSDSFVMQNATLGSPEGAICITTKLRPRRGILGDRPHSPLLGLMMKQGRLVCDPYWAPIIIRLFQLSGGSLSRRQVLDATRREFPEVSELRAWTESSLSKRLRDPRYCGHELCTGRRWARTLGDCRPSVLYPALASPQDWSRANRLPFSSGESPMETGYTNAS